MKNSARKIILASVFCLMAFFMAMMAIAGCGNGYNGWDVESPGTMSPIMSPPDFGSPSPFPGYAYYGSWTTAKNGEDATVSAFAGTYKGTDSAGRSVTVIICSDGQVFGAVVKSSALNILGRGTIASSGSLSANTFGVVDSESGTIAGNVSGSSITGNWDFGSNSGTWSANRVADDVDVQTFAGSYTGTYSSNSNGNFYMGVGSDGSLIMVQDGIFEGGALSSTDVSGNISGTFSSINYQGTISGNILESSALGNWYLNDI